MRKKANKCKTVPALAVVLLLALFGCGKKTEQPPPQPAPPKPAASKPPLPAVQAQVSSVKTAGGADKLLDFTTKKDPFKPFVAEQVQAPTKAAVPVRTGDLLPIQSYEVTRFKVAGIIAGLKENSALVIDPAGKGYVVKEGMMIGINNGRISRITPRGIEVVEQSRDEKGHLHKRSVILTLPKKKLGETR